MSGVALGAGPNNMSPKATASTYLDWSSITIAKCPICHQQRPTLCPWHSTIIEQAGCWQIDYVSLLQSGWFSNSFNRKRHIFLAWNTCPQDLPQVLQSGFDPLACNPTQYCIRPRNLLYTKRGTRTGTWPYHVLQHSEGAGLRETWIVLTKAQWKHQLRSDILPWCKTFLQDTACTLN